MKILITGGEGYIAKALIKGLTQYNITSVSRKDFELTNPEHVENMFGNNYFDFIIHCAISGGHRNDKDGPQVLRDNLLMYYNLLKWKDINYKSFINLGSGAEHYNPLSNYGLSKKVIAESIKNKPNFYNLRIYNVFDENELDTRFIKTNIRKSLNGDVLQAWSNKKMDFFYMDDLVLLVSRYIDLGDVLPKTIDCCYKEHYKLDEVLEIINECSNVPQPIFNLDPTPQPDYCGNFVNLLLPYKGLKQGIKNVYKILKDER